jgi:tRNA-dihydrouridine synthase A
MHGLFQGMPGARAFRRHLATGAVKPGAGADVLLAALRMVGEKISTTSADAAA